MKKIFLLLVVCIAITVPLKAQWLVNGFETVAQDSMLSYDHTSAANKAEYVILTDTVIAGGSQQGAAALKIVYSIQPNQSWGGYLGMRFYRPRAKDNTYYANNNRNLYRDSTYYNFGGAKYLSIWFNNLVPQSQVAKAKFRIRLDEGSDPASNYWNTGSAEQWFFDSWNVFDTTAGWKQLLIPLVDRGASGSPNDQGFCWTGWNDGGLGITKHVLDFNKIVKLGFEFSSSQTFAPDTTVQGVILFDNLQLLDYKYEPIIKFNDFVADTTGLTFAGNDQGKITLSEETVDTLISPSALAIDYKVNVAQSWGGYANMTRKLPEGTFLPNLALNPDLLLFVKVKTPLTPSTDTISNKIIMRLILKEKSGDTWYTRMDVKLDELALDLGWQMVKIPLIGLKGQWTQHFNRPFDGFYNVYDYANTSTFDPDSIVSYTIEFAANMLPGDPFNASILYTGKLLVSTLMQAGSREDPRLVDLIPPIPVTGISAQTVTDYVNTIIWNDVPGEAGATYNVYFSNQTFTKTSDAGVVHLPLFNLNTGVQTTTHLLRSPIADQDVTFYYGVTAKDANNNVNQPAVAGPFTNLAKGTPVISSTAPPNFVADGSLSEWVGIKPIILNAFTGDSFNGHVVPGGKLTDSLDLSAKAYLAMDANNLYVAFDVVDDTVSIDTTGPNTWAQDSPDLNIGLYDSKGLNHTGYERGAMPDHMFRFSLNRLNNDHNGTVVMYPGVNYIFKKKTLKPGYIVEARMPFTLLAALYTGDAVFVPQVGMTIPIDFSINDRDGKTGIWDREAILAYNYLNNNSSYQNQYNWAYTWYGAGPSDVQQDAEVALTFELLQNYPNPFNPTTNIKFSIPQSGNVSLKVFDILGREVMTVLNQFEGAGSYTATFDASKLATGVYIYRLESGSFRSVKKMMLIK